MPPASRPHNPSPGKSLTVLSPYQAHVKKWENCTNCHLHDRRQHTVFSRGDIPCDLLFCGESPGASEDLIGTPFIGPSGKLQDYCVRQALTRLDNPPVRIAYTNLLLCIPLDENGEKEKQPPDECVEACAPRLQEFVRIANPRLVIAVGKDPKVWLDQGLKHSIKLHKRCEVCGLPQFDTPSGVCCGRGHGGADGDEIPVRHIVHPSAILQAPREAQELMIKRNVFAIVEAIRGVIL